MTWHGARRDEAAAPSACHRLESSAAQGMRGAGSDSPHILE
ncbi:hypothetical protein [Noviherbaspirillum sedimenti]|nr:hypothetical protein [Noviherbaspirillum sedimenti]